MKKELEIRTKFDTTDFDKSVELMQKKLKELYAPQDQMRMQQQTAQRLQAMGLGGNMSQPSSSAYAQATQQGRRELEQSIKNEARIQEQLGKEIVKRSEALKKLRETQKGLIADSKEELAIKERIARISETTARQQEAYKQRDEVLNQMIDARTNGAFRGQGPGMGAGNRGGGFTPTPANMGAAVGTIGSIAGVTAAVAKATEHLAGFQMRLEAAKGAAIANTTGTDLATIYGGKSALESQYTPERAEAAGLAAEKAKWNRRTDRALGLGGVGLIGAGLVTGAASIAGMPFTMGGSALGLGAAGGMIAGGVGALYSDRARQGILGGPEYEKLIASQQSQDFRKSYEALKEQDPEKKQQLERFEQRRQQDLNTQRMLGLSDQGMFGEGGFQQRAARAGFDPDAAARMSQSIVGAGGSARMGRNSEFGLQMERAGLTNSGQILGSLSGSIQNVESNKRATISIMAEAFKIGLDNTDFAEENRKFTQSAAAIIGRVGAGNEGDQERIIRNLSMFQGERTNRGVEAAGNAYERSQERGSEVGGRRGAMRFTSAMKDPILSQFNTQDLTELLAARPEDLRTDSAFLQSYAIKGNTTAEKILESLGKATNESRFLTPGRKRRAQPLVQDLKTYMQKNKIGYSELVEKSRLGRGAKGGLDDNTLREFGQLQALVSGEEKGGFNAANIEAQTGELFGYSGTGRNKYDKGAAQAKLGDVGNKIGDLFNAFNAKDIDLAREAFVKLAPAMQEAISGVHAFAAATTEAAGKEHAASANRTDLKKGDAFNKGITGAITQQNANRPTGGSQ